MRLLMMAAAALLVSSAIASADSMAGSPGHVIGGGYPTPPASATKCFVGAPSFGAARDSRFGSWQDCPKPAGQVSAVNAQQRARSGSAAR